jgi:predicted nucleotidyltransferase component of viral defense system
VLFERIVARLHNADPGLWVLKGGMALEVRLRDEARLTKDLDLGLRADVRGSNALRDRIIEALSVDADGDGFALSVSSMKRLMEDSEGRATWRANVAADLADKPFGRMQVDVSPRMHEIDVTDFIPLPNSLGFAGITTPTIEVVSLDRHIAEKFHGMLKQFPDRENTRVRDLVDLVLLHEHGLLDTRKAAVAIRAVWSERGEVLPEALPSFPPSWPDRYLAMVAELDLAATTFEDAVTVVTGLWIEMFPTPIRL